MEFKELLVKYRKNAGLSQLQLAKQLHRELSNSTISRWESGQSKPSEKNREVLWKICRIFSLDLHQTEALFVAAGLKTIGADENDIDEVLKDISEASSKVLFLKHMGLQNTEISDKTKIPFWDVKSILQDERMGRLPTSLTRQAFERHIDRLCTRSKTFYTLIHDNTYFVDSLEKGEDLDPLQLYGHDWRLDPIRWFYLVVPNISDERYWDSRFHSELKSHISNSTFCDQYQKLQQKVEEVNSIYGPLADELVSKNPEFGSFWNQFKESTPPASYSSNCIPNAENNADTIQEEAYMPWYDRTVCFKIMKEFYEKKSDLKSMLIELEQLLAQTRQVLIPSRIESIIEKGRCSECDIRLSK